MRGGGVEGVGGGGGGGLSLVGRWASPGVTLSLQTSMK